MHSRYFLSVLISTSTFALPLLVTHLPGSLIVLFVSKNFIYIRAYLTRTEKRNQSDSVITNGSKPFLIDDRRNAGNALPRPLRGDKNFS
jgi:hypothetical protein